MIHECTGLTALTEEPAVWRRARWVACAKDDQRDAQARGMSLRQDVGAATR
jgi:hypothetical protein